MHTAQTEHSTLPIAHCSIHISHIAAWKMQTAHSTQLTENLYIIYEHSKVEIAHYTVHTAVSIYPPPSHIITAIITPPLIWP